MPPRKKTAASPAASGSPADEAQALMNEINKVFGDGAVTTAADEDLAVKRWATGILPLDFALDGGIPRGRFMEVYGPYSTLKSYYAYCAMGSVQRQGGRVALVDTEHSWDPDWGRRLGVDVDKVLISRPENAEQGVGVMEALIRQKFDLVVFDSIASAIPRQHQEVMPGEDTQPGALARVMSKGLARLNAANKHTSAIFINQTREKIGVSFGSPITTSGGKAMGFYASYRLSFVRTGKVTEDFEQWDGKKFRPAKRVVAHQISCTLEKSKLSAPHSEVWFTYDLTTGQVDNGGWLIGKGLELGLIHRTKTGHWTIPGVLDDSIHGQAKFDQFIADNPEVIEWLTEEIMPTYETAARSASRTDAAPVKKKAG